MTRTRRSRRKKLIIEAKGMTLTNPGLASYGAVVCDANTGEVLTEASAAVGEVPSTTAADYRALIAGVQAAASIDADAVVEVRMDSQVVIKQMKGKYKITGVGLPALADRVRHVTSAFADVTWRWVPRHETERASDLARAALSTDGYDAEHT